MPHDVWVMRDRPIEPSEWEAFLSTRADFQVPGEVFGKTLDGSTRQLSAQGFRWWMGHKSGMPIPVVLSSGAIHIGDGDPSAFTFAEELAVFFDGYVQEG